MSGLLSAFHVGVSGLFAARMATENAQHNIANANTPGYSRQRLSLVQHHPQITPWGAVGMGVKVDGIDRITSRFLEAEMLRQHSALSSFTTTDQNLEAIEQVMGSTNADRIGDAMGAFFDSWSDLGTPPATEGKRQAVVSAGENLARQFNHVTRQLGDIRQQNAVQLEQRTGEVNALLQRVADLNTEIIRSDSRQAVANDLVDMRGQALAELSKLVDFETIERSDGSLDVAIGGVSVVTRNNVQELRLEGGTDPSDPSRSLVTGRRNPIEIRLREGELGALLEVQDQLIPDVQRQLDGLADDLMSRVNALHESGTGPGGAGVAFFQGSGANGISVNGVLVADPGRVVTGESGAPGDNGLALEIAALAELSADGSSTLKGRYQSLVVGLATERASVANLREGQEVIAEGTRQRLENVRGVNVDEELADLVLYQRAFEASARVISTVDSMLDTLINRMI